MVGPRALVARTDAVEEQPEQESSAGWFLEFFRPHRKTLARALVLALIGAGLQMLIPVFAAIMIDHVVPHRDYTLLTLVVVAMFGAIVLTIVSNVVRVTCTIALRAPAGNNVGSPFTRQPRRKSPGPSRPGRTAVGRGSDP